MAFSKHRHAVLALAVGAVAALTALPASANPPCPAPNPTACIAWDALGGFVGIEQLDHAASGLTAVCATGVGFGDQGTLRYTMAGAAVARNSNPAVFAIGTGVLCRIFTVVNNVNVDRGGTNGVLIGPAVAASGLSNSIPFAELTSRKLCVQAIVLYSNATSFTVYGGAAGCPTGWV